MVTTDKPLTKAAARDFIKRAREALREAEALIVSGEGGEDLQQALMEASGCIGTLESALDESYGGEGVRGVEGF